MDALTTPTTTASRAFRGAVVLAAVLAVLWGTVVSPAPQNETPPPYEVGWNHRNYR